MLTELFLVVDMYMYVCVCVWYKQRYVLVLCRRPKENTGHPLFCPPSPFPLRTGSLTELGACHFSGEAGSQWVPAILLSLYLTPNATLVNTCVTVPSFLTWVLENPKSGPHTWTARCLTHGVILPAPTKCFLHKAIITQDFCCPAVAVWYSQTLR